MRQALNKFKKETARNKTQFAGLKWSRSLDRCNLLAFFLAFFRSSTFFGSVCQLSPTQIGADLTNLWAICLNEQITQALWGS